MYQDKINETARASKLTGAITCEVRGQQILVQLPAEMSGQEVSADVLLYCPSDSRKDLSRQIQTNNGQLLMDFPAGYKGQFEVKKSTGKRVGRHIIPHKNYSFNDSRLDHRFSHGGGRKPALHWYVRPLAFVFARIRR